LILSKLRVKKDVDYEVLYVPSFNDIGDKKTYGECRYTDKQIIVALDQTPTDMVKTLIHESFHAICEENQINIPHKAIHQLEDAIYRVLKLNKWIKK